MITILIFSIILLIMIIFNIFEVTFSEGYDGIYIIWYRNFNTYDELHKIKYSKKIIKFKK